MTPCDRAARRSKAPSPRGQRQHPCPHLGTVGWWSHIGPPPGHRAHGRDPEPWPAERSNAARVRLTAAGCCTAFLLLNPVLLGWGASWTASVLSLLVKLRPSQRVWGVVMVLLQRIGWCQVKRSPALAGWWRGAPLSAIGCPRIPLSPLSPLALLRAKHPLQDFPGLGPKCFAEQKMG